MTPQHGDDYDAMYIWVNCTAPLQGSTKPIRSLQMPRRRLITKGLSLISIV
jgi:hypothetical protein